MESAMLVLQRVVLPAINALLITAALIYGMFLLIESAPLELSEHKSYKLDWVQVPDDPVVKPKEDRPVKPKVLEQPPEVERTIIHSKLDVSNSVQIPIIEVEVERKQNLIYKSDQLTLAFGYPPVYPASKLKRGIEGFVTVGFSVNPVGQVYDAFIIESEPKGAFDKAALTAIAKFKYKPRYENERAVNTEGQRYVFRFEIEK